MFTGQREYSYPGSRNMPRLSQMGKTGGAQPTGYTSNKVQPSGTEEDTWLGELGGAAQTGLERGLEMAPTALINMWTRAPVEPSGSPEETESYTYREGPVESPPPNGGGPSPLLILGLLAAAGGAVYLIATR